MDVMHGAQYTGVFLERVVIPRGCARANRKRQGERDGNNVCRRWTGLKEGREIRIVRGMGSRNVMKSDDIIQEWDKGIGGGDTIRTGDKMREDDDEREGLEVFHQ